MLELPDNLIPFNRPLVFFTSKKKGHRSFNLEASNLRPSRVTLLSGKNFELSYRKQLSSLLFHNSEDVPVNSLMELAQLYDYVYQANKPIYVSCTSYVRRLPSILAVLNAFFLGNSHVIGTITTMLNNGIAEDVNQETKDS